MKSKGFTIIELLIVISVLSGLAVIFVATYPNAQKRARDTQRRNDLNQYRVALENFAFKNDGFYPQRVTSVDASTTLCVTDLDFTAGDCTDDPKKGLSVCDSSVCQYTYYTPNGGCTDGDACVTNYVIWAPLEVPSASGGYWFVCGTGKAGESVLADKLSNCT